MKYAKNTKKKILLHVPQTGMTIPATLICGRETGKTITVSAGVHSREYIGIEALIRLAQELTPENVQGTILLLHCCNYDGFLSRSADVVPHDGKNLDREFPGTVDGTQTQRLAAFLETEIIRNTDCLVDLHSGGFCENLIPHAYYHGAAKPEVCAASCRMARWTEAKYLVRSEARNGFYSHAGQCGVPAIILERGGCGLLLEDEVLADIADVKNILRGLEFLKDAPPYRIPTRWYRTAGIWMHRQAAVGIRGKSPAIKSKKENFWARSGTFSASRFAGFTRKLTAWCCIRQRLLESRQERP